MIQILGNYGLVSSRRVLSFIVFLPGLFLDLKTLLCVNIQRRLCPSRCLYTLDFCPRNFSTINTERGRDTGMDLICCANSFWMPICIMVFPSSSLAHRWGHRIDQIPIEMKTGEMTGVTVGVLKAFAQMLGLFCAQNSMFLWRKGRCAWMKCWRLSGHSLWSFRVRIRFSRFSFLWPTKGLLFI